jgi:hypothetical protein
VVKSTLKVEGKPEVIRAFKNVADDLKDMTSANQEVATMLLPDVRAGTRYKSGDLRNAWEAGSDAERAKFTNPLQYAIPQEFGSKRGVEPTLAVQGAFEAKGEEVNAKYERTIRDSGERAGLKTSG